MVALIWTFFEQRKLTQNYSCAYTEIIRAELLHSPMFGLTYRFYNRNTDNTPARNIVASVQMTVVDEGPIDDGKEPRVTSLGLTRDEMAAHAEGHIQATDTDHLDLSELHGDIDSAYNRIGVLVEDEDSTRRPAMLSFAGTLAY